MIVVAIVSDSVVTVSVTVNDAVSDVAFVVVRPSLLCVPDERFAAKLSLSCHRH